MTAAIAGPDGIIFDLDGLVIDSERSYFAAWQMAAQMMGYELSNSFCQSLSGLSWPLVEQKIQSRLGDDFDSTEFARLSGDFWREYVQEKGIGVKEGFFELLEIIQMRQIPYSLATNSSSHNARECLAWAGLENIFPCLVGKDQVERGKPAPDVFIKAAELIKQPLEKCMILEDSLTGVMAASQTRAKTVFIPSVQPPDDDAVQLADYRFASLKDLADALIACTN